jgi:hypothetical protein
VRSKPILLLNGRKRVKFVAKTGTRSVSFKANIAHICGPLKARSRECGYTG